MVGGGTFLKEGVELGLEGKGRCGRQTRGEGPFVRRALAKVQREHLGPGEGLSAHLRTLVESVLPPAAGQAWGKMQLDRRWPRSLSLGTVHIGGSLSPGKKVAAMPLPPWGPTQGIRIWVFRLRLGFPGPHSSSREP